MFSIFRKAIRKAAQNIRFDNLDLTTYKALIEFNISQDVFAGAYIEAYTQIGISHGNRVGRGINKEIKNFTPKTFAELFKELLIEWLEENAGLRIVTVRQTLINYLIDEIEKGITEGLTIRQVAANMQKLVNRRDFYRWQALRIARTESTAAANYGAWVAAKDSGVPLDKIWISAQDDRMRENEKGDLYDHDDMHLVKVEQDEDFDVQGDAVMFPGDPKGQPSNIINCRCAVSFVPKRGPDGRLIFT